MDMTKELLPKIRLVITWTVSNGETYTADCVQPVEYESEEAFLVDFEEALSSALKAEAHEFHFAGRTWQTSDFFYTTEEKPRKAKELKSIRVIDLPRIRTLEQWFEDGLNK